MGMQPFNEEKTVEQMAIEVGRSIDSLRKRWPELFPSISFSKNTLLTVDQQLVIMQTWGSRGITRNGTEGITRNGTEGITRNGTEGITRNGTEGITRNGTEGITRNGTEGITRNGTEGITRNGTEGITRNGAEGITRNGTEGITRNGTEAESTFFRRYSSALVHSGAALVLIIASVISVGEVISESSPVGDWSYLIALVICSSPLLLLSAGAKLDKYLAYATMTVTLIIEIYCNAVAINRHSSQEFVSQVNHTTALNDITLAWSLGIGLPILALLFEISLLNIIKKS